MSLLIRNVEVAGRPGLDVRIEAGRIVGIGSRLPRIANELDGQGGALIPGLCDHHIHLFGLAARADSVALEGAGTAEEVMSRISAALATRPAGTWAVPGVGVEPPPRGLDAAERRRAQARRACVTGWCTARGAAWGTRPPMVL